MVKFEESRFPQRDRRSVSPTCLAGSRLDFGIAFSRETIPALESRSRRDGQLLDYLEDYRINDGRERIAGARGGQFSGHRRTLGINEFLGKEMGQESGLQFLSNSPAN